MSDFVDAVLDTLVTLKQRHYDSDRVIIYCHPGTWDKAAQDPELYHAFGEDKNVHGRTVECTPNVPEELVITVHMDAARLGQDSITFQTVGE